MGLWGTRKKMGFWIKLFHNLDCQLPSSMRIGKVALVMLYV